MYDSCMATKTISIELDVYERLRREKRHPRESFSQVLRRARFEQSILRGSDLLELIENRKRNSSLLSLAELDRLEAAQKIDNPPENKWARS